MGMWPEEPSLSSPGPCPPSKPPSPACRAASPQVRKSKPNFAEALGVMGTLAITIFPDQGPSAPYRHAESHQFTRCIQALRMALDLASNCHQAYLDANDHLRRLFNQAFFIRLDIVNEGLHGELAPPFDVLLASEVLQSSQNDASADQIDSGVTLREVLRMPMVHKKNPSRLTRTGALLVGPFTTVLGGEGSNVPLLVPPAGFEPATHGLGNRCSIP